MITTRMAAGCLLALCSGVQAQSTVSLYGAVDLYLNSAKSGGTSYTRLEEGGNAASRLGFRGSEDLGGGLQAAFLLEAGIALDTGAGTLPGPGLMFTRQSYLALGNASGAVELGRMYTPMFFSMARSDPYAVNAVFSPQNLVAAVDGQPGLKAFNARANNMVRYRSAAGQPLVVDVAYSFGEAASPNQANGNIYGGTLGWNQAPLYLAYAFQKTLDGSATAPIASPSTSTYQAINSGYHLTPELRVMANLYRNSVNLPNVPVATISNLALEWNANAVSRFTASVAQRKLSGSPRGQTAWTLGYDHALSKRTALYLRWLQSTNGGNASVSLAGVPVAANSGDALRSVGIGLRHSF